MRIVPWIHRDGEHKVYAVRIHAGFGTLVLLAGGEWWWKINFAKRAFGIALGPICVAGTLRSKLAI